MKPFAVHMNICITEEKEDDVLKYRTIVLLSADNYINIHALIPRLEVPSPEGISWVYPPMVVDVFKNL
jgi:hypothetical protein